MTWRELADFINNKMPECNKDEEATVWDAENSCDFLPIISITPYNGSASPSEENPYSIDFN